MLMNMRNETCASRTGFVVSMLMKEEFLVLFCDADKSYTCSTGRLSPKFLENMNRELNFSVVCLSTHEKNRIDKEPENMDIGKG